MLAASIQNQTKIPFVFMQLLHEGRQLQERNSLRDYGITKDASIFLVLRLNGEAKVWGALSTSQYKSFKDALKLGLSHLTIKALLGPPFIMD